MAFTVTKPSIWALRINDNHALFEGNIKKPRPVAFLDDAESTPPEIYTQLIANPVIVINPVSQPILNKFPEINAILAGQTTLAGCCAALLVTKNEKQYSVILLGINSIIELSVITSKIVNHHLL